MIESFGQIFGSSAIALIQTNNVEMRKPSLLGSAKYVTRFARPLEAVHQDESRMSGRIFLPVTFASYLRARFDLELPGYASW